MRDFSCQKSFVTTMNVKNTNRQALSRGGSQRQSRKTEPRNGVGSTGPCMKRIEGGCSVRSNFTGESLSQGTTMLGAVSEELYNVIVVSGTWCALISKAEASRVVRGDEGKPTKELERV